MSLGALRSSSRAIALLLIVVSLAGFRHGALDDIACTPGGTEQHDESKHVVTAAARGEHADHCAICHLLRSLKPDLTVSGSAARQPDLTAAIAPREIFNRRDPATDHLPARAPPADRL